MAKMHIDITGEQLAVLKALLETVGDAQSVELFQNTMQVSFAEEFGMTDTEVAAAASSLLATINNTTII